MRYVYIAGPYTKGDQLGNIRAAIDAAEEVARAGFTPYLPHVNALWHLVYPHDPDFWYAYDLEWLNRCDALLRLPGESLGADREVECAREHDIPVYGRIHELVAYANTLIVPTPRGLVPISEAPDGPSD